MTNLSTHSIYLPSNVHHHTERSVQQCVLYRTFSNKYKEYQQCTNKENWSPNRKRRLSYRVFTDRTEEQAVKQLIEKYISTEIDWYIECLFLDTASINRSDATRELCNKNNIIIVPIPPNTTAWIQPWDVFVFGPAMNKVRKAMKHALNTDKRPSILMSCDELHKTIHEMRSEDIVQCWMNIAHQTTDEIKGKLVHHLKGVDLHRYQPNLNLTILETL